MSASLIVLATSYPGDAHLHPTLHFTPSYISDRGGWHDIAGAITHKGVHHIFQGQGWNHATSTDLVRWKTAPHGPAAIHETYAGMDSYQDPCSGYVTKDADGTVCAGFRQCGSRRGVNKPGAKPWDVPLELRCALDDDLTQFEANQSRFDFLFNVSFWRPIPYDPARPWVEEADQHWYQLLSMDACNATNATERAHGCPAGGQDRPLPMICPRFG